MRSHHRRDRHPGVDVGAGLFDILRRRDERRIGLMMPYTADVQAAILASFGRDGLTVVAERHLDLRDNFSFGCVDTATLDGVVRDVAAARPDAVVVLCTNLAAAPLVARLERELGLPMHDSVETAIHGALDRIGVASDQITGCGALFR